jgi:hypothetical protein
VHPWWSAEQEKAPLEVRPIPSLAQKMHWREYALPDYSREGRLHLTTLYSRSVAILFDTGARLMATVVLARMQGLRCSGKGWRID